MDGSPCPLHEPMVEWAARVVQRRSARGVAHRGGQQPYQLLGEPVVDVCPPRREQPAVGEFRPRIDVPAYQWNGEQVAAFSSPSLQRLAGVGLRIAF